MPDLAAAFRSAPAEAFSATVYRICTAPYAGNVASMRGAFLHGARYNVRGYFGALYASLSRQTAQLEMARYFTVPPLGGFVEADLRLRLTRVVDLANPRFQRRLGISRSQLTESAWSLTQEIGLHAWESGIEALLVPSAAAPGERNVAILLDNQQPSWRVELLKVSPV
jgi:RES domain-containing protein